MTFYQHVFGEEKAERKHPLRLSSSWDFVDMHFPGIHVLLDGEPFPLSRRQKRLLTRTLYIGHKSLPGAVTLPFLSLSFAERNVSPLALLTTPVVYSKRPFFAAYLASQSVPHREKYFNELVMFAREHKLGEVHALGSCYGSHPETRKRIPEEFQRSQNRYQDAAVELFRNYNFVLSMENTIQPGYMTEKPVSALLAGSIPIYYGTQDIHTILNPEAFVFVPPGSSLQDALGPVALNESKLAQMTCSPRLKDQESLRIFSWHKEVESYLSAAGQQQSLRQEILEKVRLFP